MSQSLCPLRLERLEEKNMLAGDVTVAVVSGALMIHGDELGNQIAVSSGQAPGEYLIRGLEGTTVRLVDGQDPGDPGPAEGDSPDGGIVVSGVWRGIHVAMHEGNDSVYLHDARVRGNVSIRTGEGADLVSVGLPPDPEPGPASIEGDQNGLPLPMGVGIRGSLLIRGGTENDTVQLGGQPEPGTGTMVEAAGEGPGGPILRVGRSVGVDLGAGEDALAVDSANVRLALVANGGLDADSIDIANTHARRVGLHGGAGDFADSVTLRRVHAGIAGIGTGAGNDAVEIADSAFGMLGVNLGEGDDSVSSSGTRARLAILLGGNGEGDAWNDLGGNAFGRLVLRGFELPLEPVVEEQPQGEPVLA